MNAFVTSRLDFCNSLLYGLKGNQLQKLQRVQNAAARVICNISRYEHISPSLYKLHRLPVSYRIQFKILLFVYKLTLNGLAPLYLSELIELKKPGRYNLRTNSDTLLLKYPQAAQTLFVIYIRDSIALRLNHLRECMKMVRKSL